MSTRLEEVIRSIVATCFTIIAGAILLHIFTNPPESFTLATKMLQIAYAIAFITIASIVFFDYGISTTFAVLVSMCIFAGNAMSAVIRTDLDASKPELVIPVIVSGLLMYVLKMRVSRTSFPTKD